MSLAGKGIYRHSVCPGRPCYEPVSTAIEGALSSAASRIFFAGCCAMSASSSLKWRRLTSEMFAETRVTGAEEDAGEEREDTDADASGGVPLLFERDFAGSLT